VVGGTGIEPMTLGL